MASKFITEIKNSKFKCFCYVTEILKQNQEKLTLMIWPMTKSLMGILKKIIKNKKTLKN